MPHSSNLETRSTPGTLERMVHWLALVGSFLLLGGIVMFADMRPSVHQAALKPVPIEASR